MNTEYRGPEAKKIQSMFSTVAGKYDLANTVLSLGIHHYWRKKAVRLSHAALGQKVLDCATGTGDLAIEFKKAVGTGQVIGTDFCQDMMTTAPEKSSHQGLQIQFQQADVTQLPFQDQEFDICSISFGIRNVQDPIKGLSEMARVVKSKGRVVVLEFGQPTLPVLSQAYRLYSTTLLPKIGGWVTGQPEAYNYLQNSSANFPSGENFVRWMKDLNVFENVECHSLSGGIAYLYVGFKK